MFYYAQIDENNICIGVSQLSGEVNLPSMILLDIQDASLLGRRYNNGAWEEAAQPEPTVPEPTEQDFLQAEILLNQVSILENQHAQDAVMAEILLGQLGV